MCYSPSWTWSLVVRALSAGLSTLLLWLSRQQVEQLLAAVVQLGIDERCIAELCKLRDTAD